MNTMMMYMVSCEVAIQGHPHYPVIPSAVDTLSALQTHHQLDHMIIISYNKLDHMIMTSYDKLDHMIVSMTIPSCLCCYTAHMTSSYHKLDGLVTNG